MARDPASSWNHDTAWMLYKSARSLAGSDDNRFAELLRKWLPEKGFPLPMWLQQPPLGPVPPPPLAIAPPPPAP